MWERVEMERGRRISMSVLRRVKSADPRTHLTHRVPKAGDCHILTIEDRSNVACFFSLLPTSNPTQRCLRFLCHRLPAISGISLSYVDLHLLYHYRAPCVHPSLYPFTGPRGALWPVHNPAIISDTWPENPHNLKEARNRENSGEIGDEGSVVEKEIRIEPWRAIEGGCLPASVGLGRCLPVAMQKLAGIVRGK